MTRNEWGSLQSVMSLITMAIVAGTVAAAFRWGSDAMQSQVVGGVMAMGGGVTAWHFGSSRSSQAKDATIDALAKSPAPPAG